MNPEIETVISIAPPSQEAKKIDDRILGWLKYFPTRLTDGNKIYTTSKRIYSRPGKTTFSRATPVSKRSQKFKIDETDVDAMINAIEKERILEPKYYEQILDMAALTVSRLDHVSLSEDFLGMMDDVLRDMHKRRQYEIGIHVSLNILCKLNESVKMGKH